MSSEIEITFDEIELNGFGTKYGNYVKLLTERGLQFKYCTAMRHVFFSFLKSFMMKYQHAR